MSTNNVKFKISTATIVRTVCLLLALLNLLLSSLGKPMLPIENATVEQFITALATIVIALVNWWNNNSFTQEAIKADNLLNEWQGKTSK